MLLQFILVHIPTGSFSPVFPIFSCLNLEQRRSNTERSSIYFRSRKIAMAVHSRRSLNQCVWWTPWSKNDVLRQHLTPPNQYLLFSFPMLVFWDIAIFHFFVKIVQEFVHKLSFLICKISSWLWIICSPTDT